MSAIADTYLFGPASELAVEASTAEEILVPVVASLNGAAVVPTSLTVDYSIEAAAIPPTVPSWSAALWSTSNQFASPVYRVAVPVSGLSVGEYDLWLRIIDSPNEPVHYVGRLQVR